MDDQHKTKVQLIAELETLRQQLAERKHQMAQDLVNADTAPLGAMRPR